MALRMTIAAPQNIGAVPHGTRRTAPLSGGSFEGPRLRGTVQLGGSADWLLLRADGVLELDLRATLRTDDGALVSMRSFGLRHGPPEVIAAIARSEAVDPATYYFRTTPRFETAHPGRRQLDHCEGRRTFELDLRVTTTSQSTSVSSLNGSSRFSGAAGVGGLTMSGRMGLGINDDTTIPSAMRPAA